MGRERCPNQTSPWPRSSQWGLAYLVHVDPGGRSHWGPGARGPGMLICWGPVHWTWEAGHTMGPASVDEKIGHARGLARVDLGNWSRRVPGDSAGGTM